MDVGSKKGKEKESNPGGAEQDKEESSLSCLEAREWGLNIPTLPDSLGVCGGGGRGGGGNNSQAPWLQSLKGNPPEKVRVMSP